jgi:hypothetical protein
VGGGGRREKIHPTTLQQFLVKKSFNIQELLHHKFKRHGTTPMHPLSSRAFEGHQEHNLKHPGSVDLIIKLQNKQTNKQTKCIPS